MAAAYLRVYIGGEKVRTFGGNGKRVREEAQWYTDANTLSLASRHGMAEVEQVWDGIHIEYCKRGRVRWSYTRKNGVWKWDQAKPGMNGAQYHFHVPGWDGYSK